MIKQITLLESANGYLIFIFSYSISKVYLYKRIVQAKCFIDTHFAEAIDLDNISDEAWFSKFHFIRLFKKVYNKTPHQYLIQVRIRQAQLFLEQGQPVTHVCFHVGFSSLGSFATLFKKNKGVTPSQYQQQYRLRQQQIKTAPLAFIPNCFAAKKGWTRNSNFEEAF